MSKRWGARVVHDGLGPVIRPRRALVCHGKEGRGFAKTGYEAPGVRA